MQHELLNNVPLGLLTRMRQNPFEYPEVYVFLITDSQGQVLGYAHHTPPHPLCLSYMSDEVAVFFARSLAARGHGFTRVHGCEPIISGFTSAYPEFDQRIQEKDEQELFCLQELIPVRPCSGKPQIAIETQRSTVISWLHAFNRDCRLPAMTDEYWYKLFANRIASHDLWVWLDQSRPVAMACAGRHLPHGRSIGWVYTPPELRGRGYASNLVSRLSQSLLQKHDYVCLFTQRSNPTSNKIYRAMGYQSVAIFTECLMRPKTFGLT